MIDSVASLVTALEESGVLERAQRDEVAATLAPRFTDARELARELVRRQWLTPYQVGQVFQDGGGELLLGPYVLLQLLGTGGMGRVFKARHRLMNRTVAIKVLNPSALAQPEAIRRFTGEIRAAAQLTHPNIVLAHDAAQTGEHYFLVMEYVEGLDLARLVKEHGPLPIGPACDYVRQAALGLQHAHERGLVHRDIKPSNLLVTSPGAAVKILDLGIAGLAPGRQPELAAGEARPARMLIGTPDYMAPEQARDCDQADIRSDIYSLGCTLYFLLAGRAPFPEGTQAEKLRRHEADEPEPIGKLRPEVPAALAAVVCRMMAKRPEDRYQAAAAAAQALEPFAESGSCDTRFVLEMDGQSMAALDPEQPTVTQSRPGAPEDTQEQPPSSAAGTRGPGVLTAAAAVLLVGGLAYLGWLLLRPKEPTPEPAAPGGRHEGIVRAVVFSPDGLLVASGGGDSVIRLWNVPGLELQGVLRGHADTVYSVAFSADGRQLLSGSGDNTLLLWDVATGLPLKRFKGHHWLVQGVAFFPDGRRVLSGCADATLCSWDIQDARQLHCFRGHRSAVTAVAVSPDGRWVLSGSQDRTIRLWDSRDGHEERRFEGHTAGVWSVAFAPDGRRVLSASEDKTIRLWDVKTGRSLRRFEGHRGPVYGALFTPDGRRILSASEDGTVRLWEVNSGRELRSYEGHTDGVRSLALSRNGRWAVSGGRDMTVRLWEMPPSGGR